MSSSKSSEKHWWFNTKTQKAEFGRQTGSLNRMGPFASEQEAQRAMEIARERSKQWQAQDESES
jgi:hypothetical protein